MIRINSQSGKGGVAHVLRRDHGLELPRWLQVDFSAAVQGLAEDSEAEVSSDDIFALFTKTYLSTADRWQLGDYQLSRARRIRRPSGNPAWSPGRGRSKRQRQRCCRCLRAGHGALYRSAYRVSGVL